MSIIIRDKTELLEHKQLNCIDWSVWQFVFNYQINESNLKFFNDKFNSEDISRFISEEEFYCYLIANKGDIGDLKSKGLLERIDFEKILLICGHYKNVKILDLFRELGLMNIKNDIFKSVPDYYQAFIQACENGHIEIAKWLYLHKLVEIKQAMLQDYRCAIFYSVVRQGHVEVIKWLYEIAPADIRGVMLDFCSGSIFHQVALMNDFELIKLFLDRSEHMAYAESCYEYQEKYVTRYIAEKIQELKDNSVEFYSKNPGMTFKIDKDSIKHTFYMLRNLIRRDEHCLLDDIQFLLDIPGIRDIAHTKVYSDEDEKELSLLGINKNEENALLRFAISQGEENELLRLAITQGNESVVRLLVAIPKVQELAKKNNFYKKMPGKKFDLEDFLSRKTLTKSATFGKKPASAGRLKI